MLWGVWIYCSIFKECLTKVGHVLQEMATCCVCGRRSSTHTWSWSCSVEESCWRESAGSNISAKRRPAASCANWCLLSVTCTTSEWCIGTLNQRYETSTMWSYCWKFFCLGRVCLAVVNTTWLDHMLLRQNYCVFLNKVWCVELSQWLCNLSQNKGKIVWP